MKRILSIVLLLAMCIGCFAGCAGKTSDNDNETTAATQPTEGTSTNALTAAKDYVFQLYKDAANVTSTDYTVVSQVIIQGVTYPITWTTDAPAENIKVVANENKTTTIEITAGETDIEYKLTATLKDADGNEISVYFKHTIPAKVAVEGAKVLVYPKDNKYVTGTMHLYKTKYELILSENKADALPMVVVDNGDDTVSFKAGDKYLYCDANTVEFAAEESDNTKFVMEATDGGYFIKCAIAAYGSGDAKKPQYLEVYSGYLTCYGMDASKADIYTFQLEDAEGATGVVKYENEETSTPDTTPDTTTPSTTTPPTAGTPSVSTGASVTFDFTTLDKQGVEITADEALALFNGVASGSGLTGVTLTKIYNGNSTGGAHPNAAGFIRCGKSDANGDLVLTFDKKVAKVEILCHDWYAKSSQYPTNNNQVAVNGGTAQLAPYNETGAAATMTFNLDGSSNTVDFDFSSTQSGKTGRVFIFKMIVTFVA